jgi:inner membrane transporter RhtA
MSLETQPLPMIGAAEAPRGPRAAGVLLVLGSCMSLQIGAAFATELFPAVGTWATTALRLGISAAVLVLWVRPNVRGWNRSQWLTVIAFGCALAAMNGSFYVAIDRIPLGVAVAIEFLGPLTLAAVLSHRARDLLWTALALGGMALFFVNDTSGGERLDPLGVIAVLIAAAFWAAYILTSHRVGEIVPGRSGLAIALVVAALLLSPFGIGAVPKLVGDPHLLILGVGTAVLASVIPYSFEFAALRRLPRPVFGVLLSIEPVFATLAGAILLGQHVSLLTAAAIALVVAASLGSTMTAPASGKTR